MLQLMVKICVEQKKTYLSKFTKLVKMWGVQIFWLFIVLSTCVLQKIFEFITLLNQYCQWWTSFAFMDLISIMNFCQKWKLNILTGLEVKFYCSFFELWTQIEIFLNQEDGPQPLLADTNWFLKLSFLCKLEDVFKWTYMQNLAAVKSF